MLDATINRRGIRLDRSFVEAAQTLAIQERNAINLRLAQLTAGSITSVDQVKRFVELINAHGHAMTTLNKRGVAAVLASEPDAFVRELLELRRKGARASARKFARMLMFASDAGRSAARNLALARRRTRSMGRTRTAAAESRP